MLDKDRPIVARGSPMFSKCCPNLPVGSSWVAFEHARPHSADIMLKLPQIARRFAAIGQSRWKPDGRLPCSRLFPRNARARFRKRGAAFRLRPHPSPPSRCGPRPGRQPQLGRPTRPGPPPPPLQATARRPRRRSSRGGDERAAPMARAQRAAEAHLGAQCSARGGCPTHRQYASRRR